MDLAPSDEQRALVASLGELLDEQCGSAVVRGAESGGIDWALWRALHDFGVLTMAVPESAGGWGAGLLDLSLVAERLGAALAPVPVIETQVAARVLSRASGGHAAEALDRVLGVGAIVTFAPRPAVGGRAGLVPAGAIADGAVVMGDDRLLIAATTDDCRQVIANLAAAPLADIELRDVQDLCGGEDALREFDRGVDEWLVLTAAQLLGSAESAYRMTCEYAVERETWGRPIGSYQGVSHPLADTATAIDGARLLVRKAAWAADVGDSRARELAAMAFGFAAESARDATYRAVHFHGGVGFTLEHDAQLHYRRVRGWARLWGSPRDAYLRVAASRYPRSA